jgi:precorrin-6B methylase 2
MANPRPKIAKPPTLAEQSDRHRLYELSVQNPQAEITFIDAAFRALRRRRARLLREDFCGTAAVSCEWARLRPTNRAIGVDLDAEVLAWARAHNLGRLPPDAAARVELIQSDVRKVRAEPPDAIVAMNFSYWLFKERKQLKAYFRRVREALAEGGILFLDAYGGYDSYREITEERELDGFTYIWDQAKFEPISNGLICHIHFSFPDGSRLEKAFSYDWRLWSLPEIRELLQEAGFRQVTVYWQGFDEDGEPDGVFVPVGEGDADAGWICYLSAEK